jgi:hypothetical protein
MLRDEPVYCLQKLSVLWTLRQAGRDLRSLQAVEKQAVAAGKLFGRKLPDKTERHLEEER